MGIVHTLHLSISNSFQGQQTFLLESFVAYQHWHTDMLLQSNRQSVFTCYSGGRASPDSRAIFQGISLRPLRIDLSYQVATKKVPISATFPKLRCLNNINDIVSDRMPILIRCYSLLVLLIEKASLGSVKNTIAFFCCEERI